MAEATTNAVTTPSEFNFMDAFSYCMRFAITPTPTELEVGVGTNPRNHTQSA
jgi:hypothetical protein